MFFRFLIFSIILNFSVCADQEEQEENSSLIDLQGMPTSIVAGCVNAITGNYIENHVDLQLPGPNHVPFVASYNSAAQEEGFLKCGWDSNLNGKAQHW